MKKDLTQSKRELDDAISQNNRYQSRIDFLNDQINELKTGVEVLRCFVGYVWHLWIVEMGNCRACTDSTTLSAKNEQSSVSADESEAEDAEDAPDSQIILDSQPKTTPVTAPQDQNCALNAVLEPQQNEQIVTAPIRHTVETPQPIASNVKSCHTSIFIPVYVLIFSGLAFVIGIILIIACQYKRKPPAHASIALNSSSASNVSNASIAMEGTEVAEQCKEESEDNVDVVQNEIASIAPRDTNIEVEESSPELLMDAYQLTPRMSHVSSEGVNRPRMPSGSSEELYDGRKSDPTTHELDEIVQTDDPLIAD